MTVHHGRKTFDFKWFRDHLLGEILPNWLKSAVTKEGLFLPHLDRRWKRLDDGYGTLVSQSRLLYNFAQGYKLTGNEKYRQAVEAGARFLLLNFRDKEYDGWFWSCARDGKILDACKDSYGHAFVIFGLAHAFRVTGNEDLKAAALDTWKILNTHFRDKHGGFSWRMTRDFKELEETKSQNPIMHLFEALLALGDLEGLSSIRKDAETVADFVLTKLVRKRGGVLPEVFTRDWGELSAEEGGNIDIGHAFEWAYLLSTSVERGLSETYLSQAACFLEYGLQIGFDPEEGGIFSPATPEGKIAMRRKGFWEQCEAIRALMHFAVIRGRSDLWQPLERTVDFVKRYYIDPEFGGWYFDLETGDQRKGSEWKVDYHITGMCVEAIRLAQIFSVPQKKN